MAKTNEEVKKEADAIADELTKANAAAKSSLNSKKLISAIIGAAIVGVGSYFGLPEETIYTIASLFGLQIIGQSYVDRKKVQQ